MGIHNWPTRQNNIVIIINERTNILQQSETFESVCPWRSRVLRSARPVQMTTPSVFAFRTCTRNAVPTNCVYDAIQTVFSSMSLRAHAYDLPSYVITILFIIYVCIRKCRSSSVWTVRRGSRSDDGYKLWVCSSDIEKCTSVKHVFMSTSGRCYFVRNSFVWKNRKRTCYVVWFFFNFNITSSWDTPTCLNLFLFLVVRYKKKKLLIRRIAALFFRR